MLAIRSLLSSICFAGMIIAAAIAAFCIFFMEDHGYNIQLTIACLVAILVFAKGRGYFK